MGGNIVMKLHINEDMDISKYRLTKFVDKLSNNWMVEIPYYSY